MRCIVWGKFSEDIYLIYDTEDQDYVVYKRGFCIDTIFQPEDYNNIKDLYFKNLERNVYSTGQYDDILREAINHYELTLNS